MLKVLTYPCQRQLDQVGNCINSLLPKLAHMGLTSLESSAGKSVIHLENFIEPHLFEECLTGVHIIVGP